VEVERIAIVAALIGGIAWISMIVVLLVRGGPDPGSLPGDLTFFAGAVAVTIAGGTAAWALTAGTRVWLRAMASVAGALLPFAIIGVLQLGASRALPDAGWFRDEAAFLVLGIAALSFYAWFARQRGLSPDR
jgi:hypothetical protein